MAGNVLRGLSLGFIKSFVGLGLLCGGKIAQIFNLHFVIELFPLYGP